MSPSSAISITVGSRFEELELVDQLLEEVAGGMGFSESDLANLLLATREAVANAMRHGNHLEQDKRVVVEVQLQPAALELVVRDQGEGFDPGALPDPLAPANILKPSGRGIFLMRKLMDEVTFDFPESGGTVVTMRRDAPTEPVDEE